MEMSKKSSTSRQPRISPSPFSSSAERAELERALLPSATVETTASSATQNGGAIPTVTAVPVVADTFYRNHAPPMAVATIASLPPPPSNASVARSGTNHALAKVPTAKLTSSKESELSMDGDVIVRPEPPSYDDGSARPSAPDLATSEYDVPFSQQQSTSSQLRAANAMGSISSGEEMAGVARAQRRAPSERHAVRTANANASVKAGRGDEGLTVEEDLYHGNTAVVLEAKGEQRVDLYGTTKTEGKGGYEVNEYEISEYDTFDYDVKEYKSIYD